MRRPVLALAAGLVLAVGACADPDDPAHDVALVSEGTLTVCADAPVEPFVIEDPDGPSGHGGFDIELLEDFADELGLDLAVRVVPFEDIVSATAMAADGCDVGASAITIREDWADSVAFSAPYYRTRQSLLVRTASGIDDPAETAGRRIGVASGTPAEECAGNVLPEGAEIVALDTVGDLLAALEGGSVDGIIQDLPANVERERSDPSATVVATFDSGDDYGFVVARGRDDDLLEALDVHLAAMRADGRHDEVYERHFHTDDTGSPCGTSAD